MILYASFAVLFIFLAGPLYYIWWKFGKKDKVVELLALVYTFGSIFLFSLNFIF